MLPIQISEDEGSDDCDDEDGFFGLLGGGGGSDGGECEGDNNGPLG